MIAAAPLRHARQLLVLSVFGYRLLEWWHAPDHAPLPPPKLIPPPPPAPLRAANRQVGSHSACCLSAPAYTPDMAPLKSDLCAVCHMQLYDPVAAPSGYVFCAACAHAAVRNQGRCPLTGLAMRSEDIVRLFETSRAT